MDIGLMYIHMQLWLVHLLQIRGLLHKTLTGEKTRVKSENSGKHEFTIDFTIGRKLRLN